MLFSSGGLTKVLTRLEKEALIERCENPDDKRSKLVKLSQKGKLLVEEIMPVLHQREKRMVAALSSEDLTQLDGLMQRITQSMNSNGETYPTRIQFMGASKN